jgi:hypothetical protein
MKAEGLPAEPTSCAKEYGGLRRLKVRSPPEADAPLPQTEAG